MRKRMVVIGIFSLLLFIPGSAFAHAVGSADNSAQGLVKQAIAFLEGVHDAHKARIDIQRATTAIGEDLLNQDKLQQALALLQQPNRVKENQASILLAESLGKNPKHTVILAYDPKYVPSRFNTALLAVAGLSVLLGVIVIAATRERKS